MPDFINGRDLSRAYYTAVVRPILLDHDPDLPHAAGLIRYGSEVLGFDDVMSTDHEWGPSVMIFLRNDDAARVAELDALISKSLPNAFRGYPTRFVDALNDPGTLVMATDDDPNATNKVTILVMAAYFQEHINWDMSQPLTVVDWLTFPSQLLLLTTTGPLHYDGIGDLTRLRQELAWYPHDVWLYMMMAQWNRIAEEEALMGRSGLRGDELGSGVIANRLTSDIMRLCFLMEKRYAPYPKWFGTAFQQLDCAAAFTPKLRAFQLAQTHQQRQSAYDDLLPLIHEKHNDLGLTTPVETASRQYFGRPLRVSRAVEIAALLREKITDPEVVKLFKLPSPIGSIDQITDETTLRSYVDWRTKLTRLYA